MIDHALLLGRLKYLAEAEYNARNAQDDERKEDYQTPEQQPGAAARKPSFRLFR